MKKASRYTRDILQHDPHHERAITNQKYFATLAEEEPNNFIDGEVEEYVDPSHAKYEQLCREADPIVSDLFTCIVVTCIRVHAFH